MLIESCLPENFLVQIEFAMLLHADYLQILGLILAHWMQVAVFSTLLKKYFSIQCSSDGVVKLSLDLEDENLFKPHYIVVISYPAVNKGKK